MKLAKPLIMITGLPASGKSTLARAIAPTLQLPLFDKDVILEGLYDMLGVGDVAWRQKLSRTSDEIFKRLILQSQGAVMTSFWRHPNRAGKSGTPTDWIMESNFDVVEVFCKCDPQLAAARFVERKRHEGHLDNDKDPDDLSAGFQAYANLGPIGIGNLVTVDSTNPYAIDEILLDIELELKNLKNASI